MKINEFTLDQHTDILHDRFFTRYADDNCRFSINAFPHSSGGSFVLTANTIYCFPFIIDQPMRIVDETVIVQTAVGGTSIRVAIYRDTGNFYPSHLINRTDQGDISSASTGLKTTTFEPMLLKHGIYWAAVQSNGAPTLRSNTQAASFKALGFDPATLTPFSCWEFAYTFGAFPGFFPLTAQPASKDIPHFFFKVKKP